MSDRDRGRLVYSTGLGSICPGCGWPDKDCKCSSQRAASDAIPKRIVAKLRMEKKGRGGKTLAVVEGLPNKSAFLKELCSGLKRAFRPGGAGRQDRDGGRRPAEQRRLSQGAVRGTEARLRHRRGGGRRVDRAAGRSARPRPRRPREERVRRQRLTYNRRHAQAHG